MTSRLAVCERTGRVSSRPQPVLGASTTTYTCVTHDVDRDAVAANESDARSDDRIEHHARPIDARNSSRCEHDEIGLLCAAVDCAYDGRSAGLEATDEAD